MRRLLEQVRKDSKEHFSRKTLSTSGIQGVKVISNMKHLKLTACDFLVCTDCKIDLEYLFITSIINFTTQDLTYVLLETTPSQHFYTLFSLRSGLCTLSSITCCFVSSFKHFIYIRVSVLNVISLYLRCVATIAFLSSCFVFKQFWRCTFNSFVSSKIFDNVLFICFFLILLYITKKYVTFCILILSIILWYSAGWLRQCICTLHYILEHGTFYPVCIQSQYLALMLHCNTYHMEFLGHKNGFNTLF